MQYTKPMIELVFEIRRRVPADLKPSVKLANPELLQELAHFHGTCRDVISQTLIKELLQLAGSPWNTYLDEETRIEGPRKVTKVYRGQVTLEDAPRMTEGKTGAKRVYRGQVIE